MSILIKNARFIIQDSTKILERKDILIEDNKISSIGKIKDKSDIIIDGSSFIVAPSFANMHTHLPMTIFRGYAEDMNLKEWLENKIWPLEKKMKKHKELFYIGTFISLVELISSGITLVFDMYFDFDAYYKIFKEFKIRVYFAHTLFDFFEEERKEQEIKEFEKIYKKIGKEKLKNVHIALGPHAIYTASKELLEWVKEKSEEENLPVHIHLQETREEILFSIKKYGKTPTKFLKDLGLLNNKLFAAHCAWLTREDLETLGKNKVNIIHCPTSNLKLATGGNCPIVELMNKGANVLLGTDSAASNNNLDLLNEMKLAALLQKNRYEDASIIKVGDIYKMATENAGKSLGIKFGKVEEGYLADIVLIDINSIRFRPISKQRIINHIIYAMRPSDIFMTICDGEIIYIRGKKIGKYSLEEVNEKIEKFERKIKKIMKH